MAADQVIDLRLIVITDARLAAPRSIEDVVADAVAAGAPAIQLRAKDATARDMFAQARRLLGITRPAGTLLFINDRLDVALGVGADGVHLGPDDLPIALARNIAPVGFLIGTSTDDPARAREVEAAGANYIGCGAVFGTTSKDVRGERIGPARLKEVVDAVGIPVVGIGGVDVDNVQQVADAGASGSAVISAVMRSKDVGSTVELLLRPF